MDWSKAKSLLIFVFTAFNIFLFLVIFNTKEDSSISKSVIQNSKTILKNSDIEVKCEIPINIKDIGTFFLDQYPIDRNKITKSLLGKNITVINNKAELDEKTLVFDSNNFNIEFTDNNPKKITTNSLDAVRKDAENYVNKLNIIDKSFYVDSIKDSTQGYEVIFMEKYKSYIMYDNVVRVFLSKNKITLCANLKKIVNVIFNSKNIIPVYQILINSFNNVRDISIEGIDNGIKTIEMPQESDEIYQSSAMVWRISTNTDKRFFVASNGAEIK
jgi:regulatory protein YycI of two-component signal transduction system YycFG